METAEPRKIDKSAWGDGPWQNEPDRIDFEWHGLPCLMLRTEKMGNWCGYVAVGPDHPWYGVGYSNCTAKPKCDESKADGHCVHSPESLLEVHGGITYADHCAGHICHVPKPGQPDNVFWFGFDCAHFNDGMPGYRVVLGDDNLFSHGYKDVAYVRRETERLAAQLAARR